MATICRSIMVTVADRPGRLAEVTAKIRDAGLDIRAVAAWVKGDEGRMILTTSDPEKACEAACPLVDKCEFLEGVCVEAKNEPGALCEIAGKLGEAHVNIVSMHASCGDADNATIIMHTTDNAKAVEVL